MKALVQLEIFIIVSALKVGKSQNIFSWNSIAQEMNEILDKICPMKLVFLGNGVSCKNAFEIYWPLAPSFGAHLAIVSPLIFLNTLAYKVTIFFSLQKGCRVQANSFGKPVKSLTARTSISKLTQDPCLLATFEVKSYVF